MSRTPNPYDTDYLGTWDEWRAARSLENPIDDLARDLVISGHLPGLDLVSRGVMSGRVPPEAGELLLSARGRTELARRAMARGQDEEAAVHVASAEVLAERANAVRIQSARRRLAEAKRQHLAARKSLAKEKALLDAKSADAAVRQRINERRVIDQNAKEDAAREAATAWTDVLAKCSLPSPEEPA